MSEITQHTITVMLEKAQSALKAGDKKEARAWAQKVLHASADNVDAYLILASISAPKESLKYLKRVLELDPKNQKARSGMRWVAEKLKEEETQKKQNSAQEDTQAIKVKAAQKRPQKKNGSHSSIWGILLFSAIVLAGLAAFSWYGLPILNSTSKDIKDPRPAGVVVKPTLTPTATATPTPTLTPTATSTPLPTSTPKPTEKTYMDYFAHSWDIPDEVSGSDKFWIEVDLSEQMVYTYRGDTFLQSFLVSTGTSAHPTVTGTFKIYAKYPAYLMVGDGYYLPDVPYSMFFYKGYSLHGTYWHSNFGTPMSHGCVNMRTSDAEWVYENAPIGTYVYVHD